MIIVDVIVYFIVDIIVNNFGALLRFTYYKYVKREKVVLSNFQAGNTLKGPSKILFLSSLTN